VFSQLYDFAEANGITIVGGTDRTVGAAGGWVQVRALLSPYGVPELTEKSCSRIVQGGGHSLLSNTLGLGADRALQFKVVTPDGQYLTANACQNQDLFFALRGGGGGTFGVVMEMTTRVEPKPIGLRV